MRISEMTENTKSEDRVYYVHLKRLWPYIKLGLLRDGNIWSYSNQKGDQFGKARAVDKAFLSLLNAAYVLIVCTLLVVVSFWRDLHIGVGYWFGPSGALVVVSSFLFDYLGRAATGELSRTISAVSILEAWEPLRNVVLSLETKIIIPLAIVGTLIWAYGNILVDLLAGNSG